MTLIQTIFPALRGSLVPTSPRSGPARPPHLSPCEAFVPVYVSGVRYGWHGFALLTIILTAATIAGTSRVYFLALIGIEQVKLRSLEKYEALLMGTLLCIVGVLIILLENDRQ